MLEHGPMVRVEALPASATTGGEREGGWPLIPAMLLPISFPISFPHPVVLHLS